MIYSNDKHDQDGCDTILKKIFYKGLGNDRLQ